jgi:hypothetical protein
MSRNVSRRKRNAELWRAYEAQLAGRYEPPAKPEPVTVRVTAEEPADARRAA